MISAAVRVIGTDAALILFVHANNVNLTRESGRRNGRRGCERLGGRGGRGHGVVDVNSAGGNGERGGGRPGGRGHGLVSLIGGAGAHGGHFCTMRSGTMHGFHGNQEKWRTMVSGIAELPAGPRASDRKLIGGPVGLIASGRFVQKPMRILVGIQKRTLAGGRKACGCTLFSPKTNQNQAYAGRERANGERRL